jgi:RimJ/RimL family protein N-acetyltransferase
MLPSKIETSRCILRSYRPGDGPMYYEVGRRNYEHLGRYESGNPVRYLKDEEDAERVVRELAAAYAGGKSYFLGVFAKESGEFVAQVYVGLSNPDLPEYEVGYFADLGFQGQGYVSEAVAGVIRSIFAALKAERIRLECDDTNRRSQRVAERCGFTLEGHFRENQRNPDGSISGTMVYGLLRREYLAAPSNRLTAS